jgi:hypothetical protein
VRLPRLVALVLSAATPVLALQASPDPQATPRPARIDLEAAWAAYRAGKRDEARRAFAAARAEDPGRAEAASGLGYVALRESRLDDALAHFEAALRLTPGNRDALVGRALVDARQGRSARALAAAEEVLARWPGDTEATEIAGRMRIATQYPDEERHLPATRAPGMQVVMRARGRVFEMRDAGGSWRPTFLKAVNLGAALPGKSPAEFPDDPALYRQWFAQMRECGFTAVRLYTIFPPVFYDELLAFNRGRPDPLYVIHGVWVEDPPGDDYAEPAFEGSFQAEMRRVVDLMHGALDLPVRPGHAAGRYRSDVSPWWIATILGREWEAYGVLAFNRRHPGLDTFDGTYVRAEKATAMERWLSAQVDYIVGYETERWNAQRATAWTNWPTLDPLHHPTESTRVEEAAWQRRKGLDVHSLEGRINDEDAVGLDMERSRATEANQGGLFASYHAYPYYPDFMVYDPGYAKARDEEGPNAYLGYLQDLARHHAAHPVFVGEVGVPSSREVAHINYQGFTHGGHGEKQQGEVNARLFRTVRRAGLTGAALFAWIDEWFKHNWLVMAYHLPAARNALWHDRQDAEQNYGLLAYRAGEGGPKVVIDGRAGEWSGPPLLAAGDGAPRLWVTSDESDLYLRLDTDPAARLGYVIAMDVIDPALGDRSFPAGVPLKSAARLEAAILFDGQAARVVLDDTYDRWADLPDQPRANDDGVFVSPRIRPNPLRITRDGQVIPSTVLEIGTLRPGTTDRSSPEFDDRAEWRQDRATGVLELRVPWGMLNVTDPSSRAVWRPGTGPQSWVTTEGIRFAVAAVPLAAGPGFKAAGAPVAVLPPADARGVVDGLALYRWPTWEVPTFHTYPKLSFEIMRRALHALPDTPLAAPDVTP